MYISLLSLSTFQKKLHQVRIQCAAAYTESAAKHTFGMLWRRVECLFWQAAVVFRKTKTDVGL